jgi:hypothetical protein
MSFGTKPPYWEMYEANKTKMAAMSGANEFLTERAAALGELVGWDFALPLADLAGAVEVEVAATGLRVEETTGEVGDTLAGASPS